MGCRDGKTVLSVTEISNSPEFFRKKQGRNLEMGSRYCVEIMEEQAMTATG